MRHAERGLCERQRDVGDHHSEVLEERQLRFSRRIHAFTSTLYSSTVETACICFKENTVFQCLPQMAGLVQPRASMGVMDASSVAVLIAGVLLGSLCTFALFVVLWCARRHRHRRRRSASCGSQEGVSEPSQSELSTARGRLERSSGVHLPARVISRVPARAHKKRYERLEDGAASRQDSCPPGTEHTSKGAAEMRELQDVVRLDACRQRLIDWLLANGEIDGLCRICRIEDAGLASRLKKQPHVLASKLAFRVFPPRTGRDPEDGHGDSTGTPITAHSFFRPLDGDSLKDSQALARRPIAFSDAEIVSFGGGAEEEELADLQAEGDASGDVSAITTTASSVRVLQQLSEAQQAVAAALAEARQRRGASQDRAQGDVVHL